MLARFWVILSFCMFADAQNKNFGGLNGKSVGKYLANLLALVIVSIILLPPITAFAAEPEPTDVSLEDIEVFDGLLVTADSLAVASYNVAYSSNPSEDISETYIFRLMSVNATSEIGADTAYPYYNEGYGIGMVSFYIPTGLTDDTAYVFRVQQNPTYYPTPQYWDFTIGASNYNDDDDQAEALRAKIITESIPLSISYSTDLTEAGEAGDTVLSAEGEIYFLAVIPGLQAMAPDLFEVEISDPDFTKRTWTYTQATFFRDRYNGTILYDFMAGYAGLFSLETTVAMNAFSIFIFVAVIMLSVAKFKASMLSALLDGYVVLLFLMLSSMFWMVWAGFMAFVSAVIGGAIIFFKRA